MSLWINDHARLVELLGTEIGCHWYAWEVEPLDTADPVFIPRPGFTQAVAALQANGVHVVPCECTGSWLQHSGDHLQHSDDQSLKM